MRYKVWRRKSDASVVGYCESEYDGFEPGGDVTNYVIAVEMTPPLMPEAPPSPLAIKLKAALADPLVPATVKALMIELAK